MVCASSIPGAWLILSFLKALRKKLWLGWPPRNDSPVQWRIQGRGLGVQGPSLIKGSGWPPSPPPYLKVWIGHYCFPKEIYQQSGHSFYLFPMSLSEARITNNLQEWDVNFELVDLAFDAISHSSWSWSISEGFRQFQHCPVHAANFLFNLFWVNVSKWPFWKQREVEWLVVLYKTCALCSAVWWRRLGVQRPLTVLKSVF